MTRSFGWTALRVALTVAILAYVLRDFHLDTAVAALQTFAWPLVVFVLALIAVDRLLMFVRWLLLIRSTSALPTRELSRIFFVSSFMGSFLPAGVGGDAARALSVTRHTREPANAIASVVVDRWMGLLAVALSGCIGVIVTHAPVPDQLRLLTIVAAAILIFGSIAGLYGDYVATHLIPERWRSWRIAQAALGLGNALGAYRRSSRVLWQVAGLSFVVQVVRIYLAWGIGRGLGITLPMSYYWVFMPFNILVILLPISVGGFGLPQGTMVWTLRPLGVSATQAFLLSALFTLAGVVGNIPGMMMYVFGRRDHGSPQHD